MPTPDLGDVVIASPTFSQHLTDLREVIKRLVGAGLSLKFSKCHFCKSLETHYCKTRQIGSWHEWNDNCQVAPDNLKSKLCIAPILVLPNFDKPFAIHTDACDVGLGATLVQTDDNSCERAVAYASHTLSKSERPYSTSEKECLGVIWALEQFCPYIEGTHVTVVIDHNSLRWLMSRPSPSGRLAIWCLRLQDYDLDIIHKPGSTNAVPNALSCNPVSHGEEVGLLPCHATVGSLNLRN